MTKIPARESFDPIDKLFLSARAGNPLAHDKLFHALGSKLRLVAAARLRGWRTEEQEDIVQEALCVVVEKLNEIEDGVQKYALQVLRHKIGSAYQTRESRPEGAPFDEHGSDSRSSRFDAESAASHSPHADYDNTIERERKVKLILSALKHLPEYCRLVLTGLLEGFSVAELWARIQLLEPSLKRSTFDKRIFDCKAKVRVLLAGQME